MENLYGVLPDCNRNCAIKLQENADFKLVGLFNLVIPEYPDKTHTRMS